MLKKILKIIASLAVLILLAAVYFYFQFKPAQQVNFGLTFSDTYAASLGFDSKQVYLDMLEDLRPTKIRLMTYWNEIEPTPGNFQFSKIDEMLTEAEKRNVEVILVVGKKQPRWPECHQPDWYNSLDSEKQEQALINMLKTSVDHFKSFKAIKTWQIENEPYFVFGINCPKQSEALVAQEIALVKSLDSRPVMLTDSGEQGNWNRTIKSGGDVLGVTMYRLVYNDRFGYYKYPLGPWFYRIKAAIFQKFTHKDLVGVELQAEPWLLAGVFNTDLVTQKSLMNPKIFQSHIEYAQKVGFSDNYLWGVEWWYWMAKKNNDWGMWAVAKDLINPQN
jgi:hypothetical protein